MDLKNYQLRALGQLRFFLEQRGLAISPPHSLPR
jgi:hypothetical protein